MLGFKGVWRRSTAVLAVFAHGQDARATLAPRTASPYALSGIRNAGNRAPIVRCK